MNFTNAWLAEPWEDKDTEIAENPARARIGDYGFGAIPSGVLVLTAGVDVHGHTRGFYWVVRGWGAKGESWLVDCGISDSWEAVLNATALRVWKIGDKSLTVTRTAIDAGFEQDIVFGFCERYRDRLVPVKGQGGQMPMGGLPFRTAAIKKTVDGKVMPYSIVLWHLNTELFKDRLARKITRPDGDNAQWWLPRGVPDEYYRQLASEEKIREHNKRTGESKMYWKLRPGGYQNHWLDCEIYAMAAADMLQVSLLRSVIEEESAPIVVVDAASESRAVLWSMDRQRNVRGGSWATKGRRGW